MDKKKVFIIGLFVILVTVIFGIVMAHELKHGDFPAHIAWAKEFSNIGYLYKIPHTLFARSVAIIRAMLPANILVWVSPFAKQVYDLKAFELSALIVMVLAYLGTFSLILTRLLKEWKTKENKTLIFACFIAIIVQIVGPIFVFTFPDRMFLGYITGNRFDSPTYILSKPFVLLLFLVVADNLFSKLNWKQILITILAVVCATTAKPSFTITLIPAVGILLILNIKKFREINWVFLIGALGIPTFIVLLSQLVINYVGDRGDRIIIAPLKEILHHVHTIPMMLLLIIMSLIFPLLFSILNWKKIKNELVFQLAWINFIIALFYGLFFAEEINFGVNNFWNSPMIAIFVLFFVTIKYWGTDLVITFQQKKKMAAGQLLTTMFLSLHFICGIIYYVATVLNTGVIVN